MTGIKKIINWAYTNNDVFYYISFLSLVFAKSLGFYSGDLEYKLIMAFSMLFLGLKLLYEIYVERSDDNGDCRSVCDVYTCKDRLCDLHDYDSDGAGT